MHTEKLPKQNKGDFIYNQQILSVRHNLWTVHDPEIKILKTRRLHIHPRKLLLYRYHCNILAVSSLLLSQSLHHGHIVLWAVLHCTIWTTIPVISVVCSACSTAIVLHECVKHGWLTVSLLCVIWTSIHSVHAEATASSLSAWCWSLAWIRARRLCFAFFLALLLWLWTFWWVWFALYFCFALRLSCATTVLSRYVENSQSCNDH